MSCRPVGRPAGWLASHRLHRGAVERHRRRHHAPLPCSSGLLEDESTFTYFPQFEDISGTSKKDNSRRKPAKCGKRRDGGGGGGGGATVMGQL